MGRYDPIEEKNSSGFLLGFLLFLGAAGGGWYFWQSQDALPVSGSKQVLDLPTVTSSPDNNDTEHASEELASGTSNLIDTVLEAPLLAPQQELLPDLSSSDPEFRQAMSGVSAELAPWLKTDGLIKKYVTIANDFSQGLWLEKHMRFLKHSQTFAVDKTDAGFFMSANNYQRYDKLAAAVAGMDTTAALQVYRKFKPLLLEVYQGFGYPVDRPLDDIFLKTAAQILAAPIVKEPIALVRPSVLYKFADKDLEALSPVSKQMLRMGPENTRIIQHKVRELVEQFVNAKE